MIFGTALLFKRGLIFTLLVRNSRYEFESLEKSKSNYLDKKVKIVAISNENHDKIQEFIERREIDLEFLKLNADLNYFGAYSLPTTIVFDKEGKESFRIASGIDFASQNFVQKILDLEKL